jgi:hypothetical protein
MKRRMATCLINVDLVHGRIRVAWRVSCIPPDARHACPRHLI